MELNQLRNKRPGHRIALVGADDAQSAGDEVDDVNRHSFAGARHPDDDTHARRSQRGDGSAQRSEVAAGLNSPAETDPAGAGGDLLGDVATRSIDGGGSTELTRQRQPCRMNVDCDGSRSQR